MRTNYFGRNIYQAGLTWELIRNLKLNTAFRYSTRAYEFDDNKNIFAWSPRIEIRYSPVKLMHLGANYSLIREDYYSRDRGDNWGNRANIWYEYRVLPSVNVRLRARVENRDFDVHPNTRTKDSVKYSFAGTVRIDLNKIKSKGSRMSTDEETDEF